MMTFTRQFPPFFHFEKKSQMKIQKKKRIKKRNKKNDAKKGA